MGIGGVVDCPTMKGWVPPGGSTRLAPAPSRGVLGTGTVTGLDGLSSMPPDRRAFSSFLAFDCAFNNSLSLRSAPGARPKGDRKVHSVVIPAAMASEEGTRRLQRDAALSTTLVPFLL